VNPFCDSHVWIFKIDSRHFHLIGITQSHVENWNCAIRHGSLLQHIFGIKSTLELHIFKLSLLHIIRFSTAIWDSYTWGQSVINCRLEGVDVL
jgi:hypothetical protein